MERRISAVGLWVVCLLAAAIIFPAAASAQIPPAAAFVPFLDVRCYDILDQPPLGVPLRLDHLNPYFQSLGLPAEDVVLQEPQQLCVPVAKNDNFPPDDVLRFISYVDWKCYGIDGPPLDIYVRLTQLNRVIAEMVGPDLRVIVREPQQLCVPVAKNGDFPPPDVLELVQWLDVKCYRVEAGQFLNGPIRLTHLNPLFADLPPEFTEFVEAAPTQLCVPVAKNGWFPPHHAYNQVAYSDVLCYNLRGRPLNMDLQLDHLNPVLREMGLPPEFVFVGDAEELCVPVAKEDYFPPF